jgi:phage tail-like protein
MKRDDITAILPSMFRSAAGNGSPLSAILDTMEALHVRTETLLANLDAVFDPMETDDAMVPFLAGWVDLDWLTACPGSGLDTGATAGRENVRKLISLAWYLSKWRGTARGLKLFLETATGVNGFSISESVADRSGRPLPFHITVSVPPEVMDRRYMIERIIENEKPAYVTYTIVDQQT